MTVSWTKIFEILFLHPISSGILAKRIITKYSRISFPWLLFFPWREEWSIKAVYIHMNLKQCLKIPFTLNTISKAETKKFLFQTTQHDTQLFLYNMADWYRWQWTDGDQRSTSKKMNNTYKSRWSCVHSSHEVCNDCLNPFHPQYNPKSKIEKLKFVFRTTQVTQPTTG